MKLLIANWKMNKDWNSSKEYLDEIENYIDNIIKTKPKISDINIIIASSFPFLDYCAKKKHILTSGQNCHYQEKGSYTGEVSASMLKSINVDYVIIGHSERRKYFLENDDILLQKVSVALKNSLKPIFCCGEPLEIRKKNEHIGYVKNQLSLIFENLDEILLKNICIAYEPIWAIGTDIIPQNHEIEEMHAAIKDYIKNHTSKHISEMISIVYGGNLNLKNAKQIFQCENVDGGLIGRASLEMDNFVKIIEELEKLL